MLPDDGLLGKGKELGAGETETVTAKLEPGLLRAGVLPPGHYAAGQKLAFEVR
jgi:hypothetical protein